MLRNMIGVKIIFAEFKFFVYTNFDVFIWVFFFFNGIIFRKPKLFLLNLNSWNFQIKVFGSFFG